MRSIESYFYVLFDGLRAVSTSAAYAAVAYFVFRWAGTF